MGSDFCTCLSDLTAPDSEDLSRDGNVNIKMNKVNNNKPKVIMILIILIYQKVIIRIIILETIIIKIILIIKILKVIIIKEILMVIKAKRVIAIVIKTVQKK